MMMRRGEKWEGADGEKVIFRSEAPLMSLSRTKTTSPQLTLNNVLNALPPFPQALG